MASCYRPIDVFVRSAGRALLVPCGDCAGCLERKRQSYMLRAEYECRAYQYRYFVGLSYSNEFLTYESYSRKEKGFPVDVISTGESLLCPYDLRLFFERFRHLVGDFSYFACGEYGDKKNTHRPHFHICLYCNIPWKEVRDKIRIAWSFVRPETSHERYFRLKRFPGSRRDHWDFRNRTLIGEIDVKPLSSRRIAYVSKYVTKQINSIEVVPPFYRCSKGFGKCFFDSEECRVLKSTNKHFAYLQSGLPCALPRYYSNRMFTLSQMQSFQMDMIFKDCPFTIEDMQNENFEECYKAWYKSKRSKELDLRRKRLLTFQGVCLL